MTVTNIKYSEKLDKPFILNFSLSVINSKKKILRQLLTLPMVVAALTKIPNLGPVAPWSRDASRDSLFESAALLFAGWSKKEMSCLKMDWNAFLLTLNTSSIPDLAKQAAFKARLVKSFSL